MRSKIVTICIWVVISLWIIVTIALFVLPINPAIAWGNAFIFAIFAIIFIYDSAKEKRLSHLPEHESSVTIIDKSVIVKEETMYVDNEFHIEKKTYYNLTFETENQRQWSFNVSEELFDTILEGDQGILTYKRSKLGDVFFVRFQRQTPNSMHF